MRTLAWCVAAARAVCAWLSASGAPLESAEPRTPPLSSKPKTKSPTKKPTIMPTDQEQYHNRAVLEPTTVDIKIR